MVRRRFPHECCGALIAVGGRIVEAFRMANTTDKAPRGGSVSARTTTGRPRRARAARGGTLVGFYHSHPNEPARPSAYDLEHAWPNLDVCHHFCPGRHAR